MEKKERATPILPVVVGTIIGLSAVVVMGYFEWAILIPRGLLSIWAHVIFGILLGSIIVLSMALVPLHLRDLRRQRNSVKS